MLPEQIKQLGVTTQLSNGALTRVDLDDEHYYFIDDPVNNINGEFCVSVTHVLDIGAPFPEGLRFYLRNTTAEESTSNMESKRDRGSKLHNALDQLMNGVTLNVKDDYRTQYEKQAVVTFMQYIRFLQPQVYKTELVVADPHLRVAGTLDFVGIVDDRRLELLLDPNKYLDRDKEGEFIVKEKYAEMLDGNPEWTKIIIDWKFTGRSAYNHKVQVTGYTKMYNDSYAEEQPVKRKFSWRFSPQHKFKFDFQESLLGYESFKRIYDTTIEYLGKFPEPPKLTVYPEKVQLFKEVEKYNEDFMEEDNGK